MDDTYLVEEGGADESSQVKKDQEKKIKWLNNAWYIIGDK